ncbi:MAG: GFA family protein [Shimia sp.]
MIGLGWISGPAQGHGRTIEEGTIIEGGCQCGALRYRVKRLGRSSVGHCRMCQRAVGNFYAALVVAEGLKLTRGERGLFASSNVSSRGFCRDCGTPLSLENVDDDVIEITTASLDHPDLVPPTRQVNHAYGWPFTDGIGALPHAENEAENDAWNAQVVSTQLPVPKRAR